MNQLPGRIMALDVWSTRERLCLASSVLRSGDQNWVSVSRALKPFGEPNRPLDWFSQKNCALQYSDLLEKVETPKRKRGERTEIETPGECIVRKLTLERIDDLKKLVVEERQRYRKLKDELEMVRSGQADDRIPAIWAEILEEKKARAEVNATHQKWLQEREVAKQAAAAALRMGKLLPVSKKAQQESAIRKPLGIGHQNSSQSEQGDESEEIQDIVDVTNSTEDASPQRTLEASSAPGLVVCTAPVASVPPPPHHSPLLNNLLRNNTSSPSFTQQQQYPPPLTPSSPSMGAPASTPPPSSTKETSPRSQLSISSPTITSLLSSTTGISTALSSSVVNLFTTALGGSQAPDTESSQSDASGQPSMPPMQQGSVQKKRQSQVYTLAGAPTLLKLLDMPLGAPGILPPLPILTTADRALTTNTVTATTTESAAVDVISTDVETTTVPVVTETEVVKNLTVSEISVEEQSKADTETAAVAVANEVVEEKQDGSLDAVDSVKAEEISTEETETFVALRSEQTNEGEINVVVLEASDEHKSQINDLTADLGMSNAAEKPAEDVDVKQAEVIIENDNNIESDTIIVVDVTGEDMESTTTVVHEEVETNLVEDIAQSTDVVKREPSFTEQSEIEPENDNKILSGTEKTEINMVAEAVMEIPAEDAVALSTTEPIVQSEVVEVELVEEDHVVHEDTKSVSNVEASKGTATTAKDIRRQEDDEIVVAVAKSTGDDGDAGVDDDDDDDSNSRLSSTTNESSGPKASESVQRSTRNRRSQRGRLSEETNVSSGRKSSRVKQTMASSAQQKESKTLTPIAVAETPLKEVDSGRSTRLTRSRRENVSIVPTTPPLPTPVVAKKREPSSRGKEHYRRDESDAIRRIKEESLEGSGREDESSGAIISSSSHIIDSLPNSPSSTIFSDDPECTRDYKLWKKSIMLVWRAAANHKFANVFLHAVTEEMAPGYRSVVYRPMDLITIKKNIENGVIKTTAEFQRDVMLLFQNAIMYNNSDHDVYQMAIEMQKEVLPHIQDYLATQLMVQSAVPKALRSRVETREQQSTPFKRNSDVGTDTGSGSGLKSQSGGGREESGEPANNKKRKRISSSDSQTVEAAAATATPHQPQTKKRRQVL